MKRFARIAAMLLCVLMLTGLTGCGTAPEKYASTVAATYGSENIYLDEANYFLRYQQWMEEAMYWDMYTQYFGYTNMWDAPADSTGAMDMGTYLKQVAMQQVLQTRILNEHAEELGVTLTDAEKTKVADAVSKMHENIAEEFFQAAPISDEALQACLEKNALANKVYKAVCDAAQVEVTDDECQMYGIEYVLLNDQKEEGSDQVTATAKEQADAIKAAVDAGADLHTAAEEREATVNTASYLLSDSTNSEMLFLASVVMKAGQTEVVEDGASCYVISRLNDIDAEATAEMREQVDTTKRGEAFNEVYAEWAAKAQTWSVTRDYENLKVGGNGKIYVELDK